MEATQKSTQEPKPEEASPSLEQLYRPIMIAAVAAGLRYPSTTKRPSHKPKKA